MSATSYTIQIKNHPRAKRVSIRINAEGDVVITKPKRVSKAFAYAFAQKQNAWIQRQLDKQHNKTVRTGITGTAEEYKRHKEDARTLVRELLEFYNNEYQFTYSGFSIRNQSSRWGSCSAKGHLSFNYKLALLPRELAEYVVVHELCHLQEMNHSVRFWGLMSQTMPDYDKRRKELAKY